MPLNNAQISALKASIAGYGFPTVYFDFTANTQVVAPSIKAVENKIHQQLRSTNSMDVLHGLANVIYWGYAQIGYRDVRVQRFIAGASSAHIDEFKTLVSGGAMPTLIQIKDIHIPQFSGVSFISKVLAFLDPMHYCVLDQQLAKISLGNGTRALDQLTQGQQIRVTAKNQLSYDSWRAECAAISSKYFGGAYRTVDIERGFFNLVQSNQLPLAQAIYENA